MILDITRTPNLLLEGIQQLHANGRCGLDLREMSVLYADIVGFSQFEQRHEPGACEHVLKSFSHVLRDSLSQHILPWNDLEVVHIWDDGFGILIPRIVSDNEHARLIHKFVLRSEDALNKRLRSSGYSTLHLRYGLSTSASILDREPGTLLYQLITLAGRSARRYATALPLFLVEELHNIINSNRITTYYQPIMQLQTRSAIGWESLSRGPAGSELERPLELFGYAERMGNLLDMERICRNQSIRQAKLRCTEKLFINLSPHILSDPSFRQGETRKLIEEVGLAPEQIVFEITEHHAIDDYAAFLKLVEHYRMQGYHIAIDDVGVGYSGLVTLMQVKPDFVKIDMELIRGIHRDPLKQDIVRAIQQISTGFSGKAIAEGIETTEELECVQQCGIQYGQGFLLGVPQPSMYTDSLRKFY